MVRKLLSNQRIQRLLYFMALILWIFLWWRTIQSGWNSKSSLEVPYSILISIPAALLLAQSIFNNRVLWFIITTLICSFFLYSIYSIGLDLVTRRLNPHHVKNLPLGLKDLLIFTAYGGFIFMVIWLLLNIRPRKAA